MELKWLGHSCFKLTHEGKTIIFDPYQENSIPGLKMVKEAADVLCCSHEHFDHNAREMVAVSGDVPEDLIIRTIQVDHDDKGGSLRGISDIYIVELDGFKIAHFGDIGCELLDDQKELLQNLDVAMIPVGGYYTIDAKQAATIVRELQPTITIPMHYSSDTYGFDEIGRVETFVQLFNPEDVQIRESNVLTITKEMTPGIQVLTYKKCE